MKKDKIMYITDETVKKITYKNDVFYVMAGGIYYHDEYGMHFIAGRNQRVGNKRYSPEEYIIEDPNLAISALKQRF